MTAFRAAKICKHFSFQVFLQGQVLSLSPNSAPARMKPRLHIAKQRSIHLLPQDIYLLNIVKSGLRSGFKFFIFYIEKQFCFSGQLQLRVLKMAKSLFVHGETVEMQKVFSTLSLQFSSVFEGRIFLLYFDDSVQKIK